jgi:hypothetical protein
MLDSFNMVTAYGQSAAARRRSRVELWNKQRQLTHGQVNPQKEGIEFYVCATSPRARERWLSERHLPALMASLRQHPQINAEPIAALLPEYPRGAGQWGGQANLALTGGTADQRDWEALRYGLGLRLRIPYPRAQLGTVLLNGRPLGSSETDGYQHWTGRGYTYLQINIPPLAAREQELFVVTCRYDPVDRRAQGVW